MVTVPKRNDIVPLDRIINELEHQGLIRVPNYGSPREGGPRRIWPVAEETGRALAQDFDTYAQHPAEPRVVDLQMHSTVPQR